MTNAQITGLKFSSLDDGGEFYNTYENFTPNSSPPKNVARGKTNPAWDHCKPLELDTNGRGQLMCLYCNKVFKGGGINRFKYIYIYISSHMCYKK